jgi:hypothetical protein
MNLALVVLAATLSWINPVQQADSSSCALFSQSWPLTDLASVRVYVQAQWAAQESLLATIPARGREGLPESFTFDLVGPCVAWTVAVDSLGHGSCRSNMVLVNGAALVPAPPSALKVTYYDVAGRVLPAPPSSGVYFERRGPAVQKRVVLH